MLAIMSTNNNIRLYLIFLYSPWHSALQTDSKWLMNGTEVYWTEGGCPEL